MIDWLYNFNEEITKQGESYWVAKTIEILSISIKTKE